MDPPDGWADFICKSDVFFDHVRQALNSPPPQIKLSCKPWNLYIFEFIAKGEADATLFSIS
jgi:hypothetical protein